MSEWLNSDNDWLFDTLHDDADESLGLERLPEIAVLVMFVLAGVVCAIVLALNLGGIL